MKIASSYCVRMLITISALSCAADAVAANLTALKKGQNVHVAMVGYGHLCDTKVQDRTADMLTLSILKTTRECGVKGALIRITEPRIAELRWERRSTKRRVSARILLSMAGVGALCAVPLTSSDPETWLLVGNYAIPALVVEKIWNAVPDREDYVLMLTCTDPLLCFAE
ncbi:MAG: hypothetical protein JOZ62_09875 [Acidobacteriaceae bacterium]|nr:hypothetical protein [Acidobacteriaceae bacterium]